MIKINGKTLSTQEIYNRLKISQGLKTNEPNATVQIQTPITFRQTDSYMQMVPMVDKMGATFYKKRYGRSFGLQISNTNFYNDENGMIQSEQTVIFTNESYVDDKPVYKYEGLDRITFNDGYLTLNAGQEDLLLYLRLHERCQTNHKWMQVDADGEPRYKPSKPFLFTEILPEKNASNDYDKVKKITAVQVLCLDETRMPLDLLIDMASSYGFGNAAKTPPKQVRVWLSQKAVENPDKFLKDYNSQAFKLSATIATAFSLGILTLGEGRRVSWGKETPFFAGKAKSIIMQLPAGSEANKHEVVASKLVEKGDSETVEAIKKLIEAKRPAQKANTEDEDAMFKVAESLGVTVEELLKLKKEKKQAVVVAE